MMSHWICEPGRETSSRDRQYGSDSLPAGDITDEAERRLAVAEGESGAEDINWGSEISSCSDTRGRELFFIIEEW